jgi:hypothetical protein
MQYTVEDILAAVASARSDLNQGENYTCREPAVFLSRPREECKNKKIKEQNNISRLSEESQQTCPSDAFDPGSEVSPEGLESSEEGVMLSVRENLTSRTYTGVEAFHNKTPRGIKINLAFQTADDAEFGAVTKVTGELKRQERFRELKDYVGDDPTFAEFVREAKRHFQADKSIEWCMGRVHARGKRSEWFANVIVLGRLENSIVTEIRVWFENEDYEFKLDLDLNDNQQQYYHSGGRYGKIQSIRKIPTLRTAERVLYK